MKLLDRIAERFGYKKAEGKRAFDAAQVSRLTSSWNATNRSMNMELRGDLGRLRARSRDLVQNNDIAKKFMQMVSTHVVGPTGFNLQAQIKLASGQPDERANEAVERAFHEWAMRGSADVTGKLSFVDVQRLAIQSAARDGEFLIRKFVGSAGGKFGIRLQVLDVDRLDHTYNDRLPGGNVVVMGVEQDSLGRPVAYWMLANHPGDEAGGPYTKRIRVPAEQVYHGFVSDRPEQSRGLPWMHAAMMRLQNLKGYEEAAVIAARVGASKMGFFTSPDGDAGPLATDGDADSGTFYQDAAPGEFGVLPPGYEFQQWNPDYPHQSYDSFTKACLRGIASGLGVAYHTLANDLEGVNYSSARAGTLEERDNWMVVQGWFVESFLIPFFNDWLDQAMLRGVITLNSGASLPVEKIDRFRRVSWQGRRWQWVDPSKDIEANIAAIGAGLKSRTQVAAEQGLDLNDVWADLQREAQTAKQMGLTLSTETPDGDTDSPTGSN